MSSRADDSTKLAPVSAGVYCARCGTVLALAALDGEPVCHMCLFGAAKERDLAWILRKTRPLTIVGGPVKVRSDEPPLRRVERII